MRPTGLRVGVHLGLLLATAASTFLTFFVTMTSDRAPAVERAVDSALFSFTALLILGAHEMGHYLLARHHGVDASLPYFIPLPLLGFGTLGAVIRLRGRVPSRDALVDIGAAGPLAGLMVALPMTVAGLMLSRVGPAVGKDTFPPSMSLWAFASGIGRALGAYLGGQGLPADQAPTVMLYGDNLVTMLAQRLVFGPLAANHEVYAHPVFLAAWLGLLVTMLNLIPVGQLDGGHLTHAWLGERAERLGRVVAGALLVLALLFSASWLVWFLIVTKLVGFGHPPVVEPTQPLSRGRKLVCAVCFVFTLLTFIPMPLGVL